MAQFVIVTVVLLGVAFLVVAVTMQQESGPRPSLRVRLTVMWWRLRSALHGAATVARQAPLAARSVARWGSAVSSRLRRIRPAEPTTGPSGDGRVEGDGASGAGGLGPTRSFESPGRPFEAPPTPALPGRRSGRALPELLPYRGRHRAKLQFGQTLEVTEIGAAPVRKGLFSEGVPTEGRPARGLSVLRLVLVMLLAGAAVGIVLLGVIFGIKGLVG